MERTIYLEQAFYQGMKCIKLIFRYDKTLVSRIRLLKACRWSSDLVAWYIPDEENFVEKLDRFLGGAYRIVPFSSLGVKELEYSDYSALKYTNLSEFVRYLIVQRYSEKSIRAYADHIRRYLAYFPHRHPMELVQEDIIRYINSLHSGEAKSLSFQNQLINALKQFYRRIPNQHVNPDLLIRPRLPFRRPLVLDPEEIEQLMAATHNLKQRLMFGIIYSSGLRISELLYLELKDIDIAKKTIHISSRNGSQERILCLSQRILCMLEEYYRQYKPSHYIFENCQSKPYTAKNIQCMFKRIRDRAGISKNATVQTLRHSFAAHLVESGTDLKYIQKALGHRNPKSTQVYAFITDKSPKVIRSPFDNFSIQETI